MRVIKMPPEGRCLFCGKAIAPREGWRSKGEVEEFRNTYGEIGEKSKHTLGNKPICGLCRGDIWAMVQDEDY